MTRKRYLAVAGILAMLLVAGFGVWMMLLPAPGVTKANFDRIEKGMTVEEVEEILGPGNYKKPRDSFFPHAATDGSEVDLVIQNGYIVDKTWYGSNETLLEKFRRWLRL